MKYNTLIKDAVPVSEIGLGAWQLGINSGWKSMTEKEAIEMVNKALEKGINFFDTAPIYGLGSGEERLGKAPYSCERPLACTITKSLQND